MNWNDWNDARRLRRAYDVARADACAAVVLHRAGKMTTLRLFMTAHRYIEAWVRLTAFDGDSEDGEEPGGILGWGG